MHAAGSPHRPLRTQTEFWSEMRTTRSDAVWARPRQDIHSLAAQIDRLDLGDRARPGFDLSAATFDLREAGRMAYKDRVRRKCSGAAV
jgi:hypothetical protein